ncbi:MAG TPA: response regulator [Polyangiales bacterium]|nr:response regulator [Polyangiales bacterium]
MRTIHKGKPPESTQRLLPLLYVEDNDENWNIVKLRLSRAYALTRAGSDREACQALSETDRFYAVLMDIELGGSRLNGIQLTRVLRGKLPSADLPDYARAVPKSDVPVLFVTAYGGAYKQQELFDAGADHVLVKPVDFTKLSLALANLHLNRITSRR